MSESPTSDNDNKNRGDAVKDPLREEFGESTAGRKGFLGEIMIKEGTRPSNNKGFSPAELQQAFDRLGRQAKINEHKVRSQYHFDDRRQSSHPENVELLLSIFTQMRS
ncbi:MAG: hypothetical protein M3247_03780 [Thermoproteota archaeon]|nr:hypothetical protein [Thermoproteota archaeon]